MAPPLRRTVNGFESQFATNHLGHALLVCKLTPALVAAGGGARVVVVASSAHKRNGIQWDDINFTHSYNKWTAYAQSKSANMLFAAVRGRRRGADAGPSAHAPSPAPSSLPRSTTGAWPARAWRPSVSTPAAS